VGARSRPYKLTELQDGTLDKIIHSLRETEAGLSGAFEREVKIAEVQHEQRKRGLCTMSDADLAKELGL
jgi:hypothetical protein